MKRLPALLALLLIAFLFTGAGCGKKESSKNPSDPTKTLTESDNGKEIEVEKNVVLQVKLPADTDKDVFWGVRKVPSHLEFLTEGKDEKTFEFNFKVLSSGPLVIEQVKFNETGVEKKKEFKVEVKVK
jgi:predicted small lipoprotein YifL